MIIFWFMTETYSYLYKSSTKLKISWNLDWKIIINIWTYFIFYFMEAGFLFGDSWLELKNIKKIQAMMTS